MKWIEKRITILIYYITIFNEVQYGNLDTKEFKCQSSVGPKCSAVISMNNRKTERKRNTLNFSNIGVGDRHDWSLLKQRTLRKSRWILI